MKKSFLENKALKELKDGTYVVATGGGIIEREENLLWMNELGETVFLHAPFNVLYERIKGDKNRPLTDQGVKKLAARYDKRKPRYNRAHIVIETANKTINQIVDEIYQNLALKE